MHELEATAVQQALQTAWIGRAYHYFPRVTSTNDLLKAAVNAPDGATLPAGTVYLADFQESGRGRLARRWEAPPGTSLLFSVLLRPDWEAERLGWLPMIAGLAVARAVEEVAGVVVGLKWPNDVVVQVDGRWHKFCGILLESGAARAMSSSYVIAGIGINVNLPAADLPAARFPATGLMLAAGAPLSRRALLAAVLGHLEALYEAAAQGQPPHAAWRERLIWQGEWVAVSGPGPGEGLHGVLAGVDESGRLLLRDEDGRVHAFAAGDVSLHGPPPEP